MEPSAATPTTAAADLRRFWTRAQSGDAAHAHAALLGLRASALPALLRRVEEGLPFSAWEHFLAATRLPGDAAARAVGIPARTLARRKDAGRLRADESDRLLRMARVFGQAVVLFEGDAGAARAWLMGSQPALQGATPLEYAATELGSREVEALIGRLEYGVPS